ncbi:hypothetical protein FGF1_32270 [Flavobacteriaceae bacterium GF1]
MIIENEKSAQKLDLSSLKNSRASDHDAQDMALIAPTGMPFLLGKGGIRHSPKEYAMENLANVFLHTILELDVGRA